ncbi:MAG: hypothetical protein DLM71_08900 [Chloroflexi bacterium]|nr:MAG: hypothetical protein DLM71_08900 [Chloroflexota bacterium]
MLAATLAVVAAAFCWGISAIFAKGAFERGISPEQMAQARVMVAVVPLVAWLALRRRDLLRPPRPALPYLVVFGAAVVAVNFSYYVAIDRLDIGVAISLQYTAPVLVLALAALTSRRAPPSLVWVAGILTLVGAILVSGAYAGFARIDPVGVAAGFAAALTFAGYLLSAEAAGRRGAHPASSLLIGFLVAILIWGLLQPWWNWPWARLSDPEIGLRVLAVGIVGTLVPFLLAVAAVRVISTPLAAIAATTEPVFASALAWLLLGQHLGPVQLLGGACVIAGVTAANLHRQPTAPEWRPG